MVKFLEFVIDRLQVFYSYQTINTVDIVAKEFWIVDLLYLLGLSTVSQQKADFDTSITLLDRLYRLIQLVTTLLVRLIFHIKVDEYDVC